MNPLQREPANPWFDDKHEDFCKAAGLRWEQTRELPGSQFSWYIKGFGDVRKKTFLPALLDMSKHCAFCDAYQMGPDIPETVEHFHPKSKFPEVAFQWHNLYLCCGNCQDKGSEFEAELLKPDDVDYQFERYFQINLRTGEIVPRVLATRADKKRAEATIRLYRLNLNGKPGARLSRWKFYKKNYHRAQREAIHQEQAFNITEHEELNIERHPYRFFIQYFLKLERFNA